MVKALRDLIAQNRAGDPVAIPSVCSAQADVIKACLMRAQTLDRMVVVEATSNQVNQDGGYTGMTPADFVGFVHRLAREAQVDRARIIFGGDHLGPQAWRNHAPALAMAKAHELVNDYVVAGFHKIHLDCSEGCAEEPAQLNDAVTAERSTALAQTCVEAMNDPAELLFVVGTEVPPPGGARMDEDGDIPATTPEAAHATMAAHVGMFGDMAPLIGGLVVQPGVEFSPMGVHHMPLDRDPGLLAAVADWPGVCLEAHSTDYQHDAVFARLAELGFAFQKVGPALTHAYREALYGLDRVRALSGGQGDLPAVMEQVMLDDPRHWQSHYHGDAAALKVQRHAGLADRIRYYWPVDAARAAVAQLRDDLDGGVSDTLLAQVFDARVLDRAADLSGSAFQRIVDAQVQLALDPYFFGRVTA